jgi:hypothetical protein
MLRDGVPADEQVVRHNAESVTPDSPPAVAPDVPEQGNVETDGNPNLGMVGRQLASHWIEGQQYTPEWLAAASDNSHAEIINRQVASAGFNAKREEAGVFGHGTMSVAVGIEPVKDLTEGGKFGNDYFVTHPKTIQGDVSQSMRVPPGWDSDSRGAVMGAGKELARESAESGLYAAFYAGVQGGS